MDYETKMLLWNISKQTEIANAIKLGETGTKFSYGIVYNNDKCKDLKIEYKIHVVPNSINYSVQNAQLVQKYWDENKPKPP